MIRRMGLGLAVLPVLAVLLVALILAFAQTSTGKRLIAGQLARALTTAETEVTVVGLTGFVPFDMRLDRLAMADEEGTWLEVRDVRLAWSPAALLEGRVRVDEISAATVELARLPAAGPEEAPAEPFRLPELPQWIPPLTLERLAIGRLALGAPVLGEPAAFSLDGRLASAEDGRSATLALDLQRVDETTATARVAATLRLDAPALELDLMAQETGGLLAAVTGEPEAGELTVNLTGSGPLADWQGDLQVEAEGLLVAAATLHLALEAQPRLKIAATVDPVAGWLPADLAPLIGERATVDLDVTQTAAQRIELAGLRIATAAAELSGNASLDFEAETVAADARLIVPELAPFGELAAIPLAGQLAATLTAEGALLQPEGRIELKAERPVVDTLSAASLESTLAFTALAPLDAPAPGVALTGQGRAIGLVAPVEGLPPQDLAWELAVKAPPAEPVEIARLALTTAQLQLTGDGRIDPKTLAGQASLKLIVDALGPLTEPFGPRIEGEGQVIADIVVAEGADRIEVDLTGDLARLAGLPPGAAELVGSELSLATRLRVEPERRVEVDDLALNGAAVTLGGRLALGLPEQALDGRLRLVLPRLAALAPLVEQDLAGRLTLDVALAGTVAAPEVELAGSGQDLVLAGQPVSGLTARARAAGPPEAVAGTVRLAATVAGIEATLGTSYQLQEQTLTLSDLALRAPRTELAGGLTIDLERTLIDGRLSGQVADLVAFDRLIPVALRGRLEVDARARAEAGGQELAVDLRARQLRSEFGRMAEAALRATVADALGAPQLDLELTAREVTQDAVHLDDARLTAQGPPDRLALTLAVNGRAIQAFDLEGGARLALGDAIELQMARLSGEVAGAPLRLAQPATVTVAGETVRLAGLDVRLADARLTGDLDLGPETVSAEARLETLPLALLGRFGAPPLNGRAAATLRVTGAVDNPAGALELTITELRGADPALADLPPAQLTVRSELRERRLSATARLDGLTDQPVRLELAMPMVVQLRPAGFAMPEDGRLDGQLSARVQLARLVDYLALDDQRLGGELDAALSLAGTIAEPLVDGTVTLEDGLYESGATGTTLREISLLARAAGRRIEVERLRATDGGAGRLSASGNIQVEPAADFPLDVELTMQSARLVARDDLQATTSGELRVDGTLAAARLGGRIRIDRAELRIPDRLGPDVAVIEVEEIGGDQEEGEPQQNGRAPLDLTLDMRIEAPGQVFVSGRGLQSEWAGELTVDGSADAPRLVGQLRLIRGFLDLTYRRLDLVEGVITLSGGTPPNPDLNIVAQTQVDEVQIRIRVAGTAETPRFSVESEPPLPEDEVMARLIFGRDASQLGPIEAAQLAIAVNQLRGGGNGFDPIGKIRSALGVDVLDVRSGETPSESTVRAGKYLNEDVYIELEQGAGQESGRARVEVEILPSLSLEADTGDDARSGVGLKWRFDY